MTSSEWTTFIKNEASKLGFDCCGIAQAAPIEHSESKHYQNWLDRKFQADMDYMTKNTEKRYDPRLLVEGCRSIVVVALNYQPAVKQDPDAPQIATFAYGKDYHDLIRNKLKDLLKSINAQGVCVNGRAFTDSAPVAERYWANQAGIGWIGRNRQLIVPGKGSKFLLGELLIDLDLVYDRPLKNRCGNCKRCLEACPTQALDQTDGLNANRCLSYLTIEKKGSFDTTECTLLKKSNRLFGCDICQDACPWNRFSISNETPEFKPKEDFLKLKRKEFEQMSPKAFDDLFEKTCLERTGYKGLLRNLHALKK